MEGESSMRSLKALLFGILAAGCNGADGDHQDPVSLRMPPFGTLDESFGENGAARLSLGTEIDLATASLLQPDGGILVAGSSWTSSSGNYTKNLGMVRFTPEGAPDPAFGTKGVVVNPCINWEYGIALALQGDKILVVGTYNQDFRIARFTTAGTLDTTFGIGGLATTNLGSLDFCSAVGIQSNGMIVAAGTTLNGSSSYDFALARYDPQGTLDASFGTAGIVKTDLGGAADFALSMVVQPDDKILVGGFAESPESKPAAARTALVRYRADGSLDVGFGDAGHALADAGGSYDLGRALTLQPDGKILLVGSTTTPERTRMVALRYDADGFLDPGFGVGGIATVEVGPRKNEA